MDGLLVSPTVLTALGCGLKAAGFITFPRFVMKALARRWPETLTEKPSPERTDPEDPEGARTPLMRHCRVGPRWLKPKALAGPS
jgi:hypothetical protein